MAQPPSDGLLRAARASFLLLVLVLPWTIAPMGIATGICAALSLAVWLRPPRQMPPRTPMSLAAIVWFAAMVMATVFAIDPAASLDRLSKGLFPLLAVLAAWHARDRTTGTRAVAVLLGSSFVASTWGLWVYVANGASMAARARGPVGHYMTFAGQLLLVVAVAAGIVLVARARPWRLGALLAATAASLALAATYTRSAWAGLAAALVVITGGMRPKWLPVLAAVLALIVVFAPASYRDRLRSAFDPSYATNVERRLMWDAGVRIFKDHPITGVGLQNLKPVYERYRAPEATEAAGHLHSVPFQIAATMGLIGLGAFVFLFVAMLRCAGGGLRASIRARTVAGGLRLGVLGALVGFFIAGLFEWNLGDEELLYPLYVLTGMAWAAADWHDDA